MSGYEQPSIDASLFLPQAIQNLGLQRDPVHKMMTRDRVTMQRRIGGLSFKYLKHPAVSATRDVLRNYSPRTGLMVRDLQHTVASNDGASLAVYIAEKTFSEVGDELGNDWGREAAQEIFAIRKRARKFINITEENGVDVRQAAATISAACDSGFEIGEPFRATLHALIDPSTQIVRGPQQARTFLRAFGLTYGVAANVLANRYFIDTQVQVARNYMERPDFQLPAE